MSKARRIDTAAPRQPVLWKGMMLYFLPLPLIPAAVMALASGQTLEAAARIAGFGLTMAAANFIRRGIRLEREAVRRRLRRRASTVPYRMIGAALASVAMLLVAWIGIGGSYSLIDGLLYAVAVMIGCYLYYGFDPAHKNPEIAAVGITTEELVELLDEAEERIAAIETSSKEIRNTEFRDRLRRIVKEARNILDTIEQDPVDARRARKFLKVYLDGAQQVTEGYARTHRAGDSSALEDNFRRVLTTIESVIAEQQQKLLENNVSDLDVNIEVLQMQLEKEGIT